MVSEDKESTHTDKFASIHLTQVLIPSWVFGNGNIRWQEELAGEA
jgi:hypothetical protein